MTVLHVLLTAAVLLLLSGGAAFVYASDPFIENDLLRMTFDETSGTLVGLIDKTNGDDLADIKSTASSSSTMPNMWTLTFVDAHGLCTTGPIGTVSVDASSSATSSSSSLALTWRGVSVMSNTNVTAVAALDVTLTVSLESSTSRYAKWQLSFDVIWGVPVGLWEGSISVPLTAGTNDKGVLFYPGGYGYIMNTKADYKQMYPGGQATMQFMALGTSGSTSAAYVAALDSSGAAKQVVFKSYTSTSTNTQPKTYNTLGFTIYPQGAGLPIKTFSNTYSVAVGVISGVSPERGRPLWYEAAIIYRGWALAEAQWTKKGPIRTTTAAKLPSWYRSNSVWINSHWACLDVFNSTGGDPDAMMELVPKISARLDEPHLSLHWYEWQQGGAGPSEEDRYKFDTHYPDYFPPRKNYKEVTKNLFEDYNVATFPYINGRIYDVNSISYAKEDGLKYCSKKAPTRLVLDNNVNMDMESYEETYGNNATFCVANPFTPYWQAKVSDVVDQLVNDWGVSGVYIDQIGSAIPKLCWDKHHHHTLGGGNFWREGYLAMMNEIASVTSKGTEKRRLADEVDKSKSKSKRSEVDGSIAPMVTEDNAEAYIDMMQGVLTLVAFRSHPSQSSSYNTVLQGNNYKILAPAFPVIYGGYYVGFGAEWFRADFEDHDWWCAKLSAGFLSGSQMGWFSLIGIDPNPEDQCGPMGVGDLILSADSDDLITFMKKLSTMRAQSTVLPYIIDGRIARPVVMNPVPPTRLQKVPSGGRPLLTYDAVSSMTWEAHDAKSVLTLITSNVNESFETTIIFDPTSWGFAPGVSIKVTQTKIGVSNPYYVGTFKEGSYSLPIKVQGRDIVALQFTPVL